MKLVLVSSRWNIKVYYQKACILFVKKLYCKWYHVSKPMCFEIASGQGHLYEMKLLIQQAKETYYNKYEALYWAMCLPMAWHDHVLRHIQGQSFALSGWYQYDTGTGNVKQKIIGLKFKKNPSVSGFVHVSPTQGRFSNQQSYKKDWLALWIPTMGLYCIVQEQMAWHRSPASDEWKQSIN